MQAHPEAVDLKALPKAHRKLFERQQADNEELRARVELLTDSNRCLEHLVSELRRAIYDKRSEKRPLNRVDGRDLGLGPAAAVLPRRRLAGPAANLSVGHGLEPLYGVAPVLMHQAAAKVVGEKRRRLARNSHGSAHLCRLHRAGDRERRRGHGGCGYQKPAQRIADQIDGLMSARR